jgi:hypothetical protein
MQSTHDRDLLKPFVSFAEEDILILFPNLCLTWKYRDLKLYTTLHTQALVRVRMNKNESSRIAWTSNNIWKGKTGLVRYFIEHE